MARLARTEVLEQKLEKHIREHADTMKSLRNELQTLKAKPKTAKDQRPFNDNVLKKAVGHNETTRKFPVKSLKNKSSAIDKGTIQNSNNHFSAGDKMTNKMKMQNHPYREEHTAECDDSIFRTESTVTSHGTFMSVPESVITRINYNGSIMSSPVSSIKLLEFLILELKTKLKDYISEDDEEMMKAFNEINHTIKKAKLERRLARESQQQILLPKTLASSSTQTNVNGAEMEKLVDFLVKHSTKHSELDTNLRRIEEIFTLELKKSDDKITKLSEDINTLQHKLRSGFDDKSTAMSHHIDLKLEEIKSEMKLLLQMIEETKNHNLIDNFNKKLEQTQKKIDEVKTKCTETAKHCLQLHVGSHLVQSHTLETKQMECELGHIKSIVDRNVRELKNVLTRTQSRLPIISASKSTSSLCLTNLSSQSEEFPSESITSSEILNEDFHHKMMTMSKCYKDKFCGNRDEAEADVTDVTVED